MDGYYPVADPENLVGGAFSNNRARSARENFWSRPLIRNHAHIITANEIGTTEQPENSMEMKFLLIQAGF